MRVLYVEIGGALGLIMWGRILVGGICCSNEGNL